MGITRFRLRFKARKGSVMRKTYDLESVPHLGASTSKDIAYARYLELARSTEPSSTAHAAAGCTGTILIEPNALLREGLKTILAETAYYPLASVASFDDIGALQLPDDMAFALIVDAARDHDETCRLTQALKEQNPSARVIMLVEQYDLKQVLCAFQAGADAYLMKSVSCEVLIKSLDLVMLGESVFPGAILDLMREQDAQPEPPADAVGEAGDDDTLPSKGLSTRETVILRCLMEGDSNKIIARKFDITEATVKVHVKAILRKIHAKNRTQAAIWAANHLSAGRSGSTR
jgi:two-component system, NarL family, nitrate/nitrite response regulator NarL